VSEKSAVIYARYSSHNQREESIEGQIRECKRYARDNDITIIAEYADRATSGRTDNRAEFQKMIRDAEKGSFSLVIVYKLDRFARNRYDSAMYKAKLKKCGVKVISATEGLTDTPESIILEAMLEGMAEYYSANLSQNVKRGMVENAMKCLATGGGRCLGYYTGSDKRYYIDEAGASTVRMIYEMYDQGHTYADIVNALNEQGRKTLRGSPFNKNSLGKILHNRRYIGDYVWDEIVIEGGMPQIIDRDLWERVQKKLSRKEKASARARGEYDYILSGKLFCGHCGKPMIGDSGTSRNGTKHYYYTCSTKKHGGGCSKQSVRAAAIEDEVIRTTIQTVLTDDMLEHIADKVMEYQSRDTDSAILIEQYKNQLKETETAIAGILRAVEAGMFSPSMKDRMDELECQKAELNADIEREEINQQKVSRDEVLFFLSQFKGGDPDDPEYKQRLVDIFVNSVWLYDDKLVLTYNYSGEDNKVTLDLVDKALSGAASGCSDSACQAPPIETKANTMIICSGVFALVKTNAGSTQ
jgi:DNA invertase Pin-like site-specific DNA recombinase